MPQKTIAVVPEYTKTDNFVEKIILVINSMIVFGMDVQIVINQILTIKIKKTWVH